LVLKKLVALDKDVKELLRRSSPSVEIKRLEETESFPGIPVDSLTKLEQMNEWLLLNKNKISLVKKNYSITNSFLTHTVHMRVIAL
jgi:hypothetical protein